MAALEGGGAEGSQVAFTFTRLLILLDMLRGWYLKINVIDESSKLSINTALRSASRR